MFSLIGFSSIGVTCQAFLSCDSDVIDLKIAASIFHVV
jgi:hypothetical protein